MKGHHSRDYFCSRENLPVWDGADFSPCWRRNILPGFIPLLLLLSSVVIIIPTILLRYLSSRTRITLTDELSSHKSSYSQSASTSAEELSVEKPTLTSREDHILLTSVQQCLEQSIENKTIDLREKTTSERVGDWVGVVGCLGYVGVVGVWLGLEKGHVQGGWERLGVFIYMTLLAITALLPTITFPAISLIPETHLPTILWLYAPAQAFIFRSTYLHRPSHSLTFIFELILLVHTVLFLVVSAMIPFRTRLDGLLAPLKAGSGSNANIASPIGYAQDPSDSHTILPNPAEPRSLLDRAIFTHVVPIVLKHYRNPLKLSDVPAIREDDTPVVAVSNWRIERREKERRQGKEEVKGTRKVTNLAGKLFWHFRELFWLQFFWSLWAVIFAFFSPIGLQLLLKFVADRKSPDPEVAGKTQTHVAVLYVALMVVGQLGSSLSQSQILNTGRRICIRLRAIIITEIYTKALRRRDASGAVSAAKPSEQKADVKENGKKGHKENLDAEKDKAKEAPAVEANVTNLVGVDAFYVSEIASYLYYFVTCGLCIIVAMIFLYKLLGVSSLAGVTTMVLLTPLQGYITQAFANTQGRLLAATDARLETATEVLGFIRTVKFAAWEDKFYDRMERSREHELKVLKKRFYIRVLANVLTQITPPLVTVVTFAFYTLYFKQPLTAATAFTSLFLFSMIRTPLAAFLEMITACTNAYVSCKRVEAFLNVDETLKYDQVSVATSPNHPQIGFVDAVISHGQEAQDDSKSDDTVNGAATETFRLKIDRLAFPVGKLSIIAGTVGCGKTTLLNSLLGETMLLSGKIFMPDDHGDRELCQIDPATGLNDTVAYCPQAPWLIGSSIRENILFGRPYNEKRYKKVLYACALERDLEIFEEGDKTIVGEKGTVCSGGQKARIALARAIYSSSRTVLCDDVTSAVDAHTARHLYNHCFKGELMKDRTLILVTHAVGLVLPGTDYAVVLENGEVKAAGTPDELKADGHFIGEELEDDGEDLVKHIAVSSNTGEAPTVEDGTLTTEMLEGQAREREEIAKQIAKDKVAEIHDPAVKKEKFFKAEKQETGSIGFAVWATYFRYLGSPFYWLLLVALFIGAQGAQIETNAWIRTWSNAVEQRHASFVRRAMSLMKLTPESHVVKHAKDDSAYYLSIYVIINIVFGLLVAGRTLATFQASLKASKVIYSQLLKAVLGARMRFFDSTPSGQILNRLSNDIQVVDQQSAEVLMLFTNSCLNTLAVLVVVTYATPAFLIAAVVISGLYAVIGSIYNATSLEVKRCDSVTKSPILVGFGEVLHGQTSIRAYADTARFTRELMTRLETNIRAFHLLWQNNRLLSVYCDVAGSLVIVFAAMFVLLNHNLDAGAAGLSLSYALTFTDFVLWIVRLWAATEQNLTSVERLGEYLKLDPEAVATAKEPPAYWPTRDAKIEIQDLTCSYAPELPPVLKNVTFTVQPGHRVGICGRTGSGKSTLALTLFRFIEASSGKISIDGIDISTITLSALRERLTILPQEAQLFSGTVRENLDPFSEHDDDVIWLALRRCGLAARTTPTASRLTSRIASRAELLNKMGDEESITTVEERVIITSLDERVAKGGNNFSAGQRQLLSLARGLLKLQHSSILVLDESTANLDHATDEAIQNVLKENLVGVTCLIVAHRLRTIIDCDRILVLDHGNVLEYDSPLNLLKQETSAFRDLCRRSGEEGTLLKMAEDAEAERRK